MNLRRFGSAGVPSCGRLTKVIASNGRADFQKLARRGPASLSFPKPHDADVAFPRAKLARHPRHSSRTPGCLLTARMHRGPSEAARCASTPFLLIRRGVVWFSSARIERAPPLLFHPLHLGRQRAEQHRRRSGDPSRLSQEGKRKLTESAREFPKASNWRSPNGSLREARTRLLSARPSPFTPSPASRGGGSSATHRR